MPEPAREPDIRTGFIAGVTFPLKEVQYEVIDGKAVFEGDIVLGDVEFLEEAAAFACDEPEIAALVARSGTSNRSFRWGGGVVPWDIDPAMDAATQTNVTQAVTHWDTSTVLTFPQRTAVNAGTFTEWMTFRPGSPGTCQSPVGRQGKQQFVDVEPGCSQGNIIHEIGHAVGLWHEHSREDRDQYVQINWGNIQPGRQINFNQNISDGDDIGPYDYGSIMHYGPTAFGIVSPATGVAATTIVPTKLPAGVTMGQRVALSAADIQNVDRIYNCQALAAKIDALRASIRSLGEELKGPPGAKAANAAKIRGKKRALAAEYRSYEGLSCAAISPISPF